MEANNPKINSEADARAWFEALIAEAEGTAHIPNPDTAHEEMGNGWFGAFADVAEGGVTLIREGSANGEPEMVAAGVGHVKRALRMSVAMERVWQVVPDPHALADEVESRRPVPDVTRPAILDTWGDVRAWFRALVSGPGFGELPKTFAEALAEAAYSPFDAAGIERLDAALARVRAGFDDVDSTFEEVHTEVEHEAAAAREVVA